MLRLRRFPDEPNHLVAGYRTLPVRERNAGAVVYVRVKPLIIVGLLVSASAHGDVSAPSSALRSGSVIIVDARNANRCSAGRHFTPSPVEVERIEARLPDALRQTATATSWVGRKAKQVLERLATDKRFYTGEITKTGRVISIEGVCRDFTSGAERCAPFIFDGGSCVWYFEFDVKTGSLIHFRTNGEA
jgi:hypothetical protein